MSDTRDPNIIINPGPEMMLKLRHKQREFVAAPFTDQYASAIVWIIEELDNVRLDGGIEASEVLHHLNVNRYNSAPVMAEKLGVDEKRARSLATMSQIEFSDAWRQVRRWSLGETPL